MIADRHELRPCSVVWFKRDLRISDHEPLYRAVHQGPVICLYILEPELYHQPDADAIHFQFILQSLSALNELLSERGSRLILRIGDAVDVLEHLRRETGFKRLYSHEETGNGFTYQRDLKVKDWCAAQNIPWHEYRQFGVVRALKDRNGWAKQWRELMARPLVPTPVAIDSPADVVTHGVPTHADLGLSPRIECIHQKGGVSAALATLHGFLENRGLGYGRDISSPLSSALSGSRLSPYLTYGNLSLRSVKHALAQKRQALANRALLPEERQWNKSLSAFDQRLHWHCHFVQKLESQPSIEFHNMSRIYDGLRENHVNDEWLERWAKGETGYPMVDACMRSLTATGWLNFRMRAMLVSFASYHLWLDWRLTAPILATRFLDYEAGIHYSQIQMQSGTTGINQIRIYSPEKQAIDQDPRGAFIRRWVPELDGLPDKKIAAPYRLTKDEQHKYGVVIGQSYPDAIVEHVTAVRAAKERLYSVRRSQEARSESKAVFVRHGSRRGSMKSRRKSAPARKQLDLF